METSGLSENSKIRRICLFRHKARMRQAEKNICLHQNLLKKRSRSFSQGVLLYLAENSQIRHQRQVRLNKTMKMFRVHLDEADSTMLSLSVKQTLPKQKTVTVKDIKKTEDADRQNTHRSFSIASEASSIEETFRRAKLRSRARSIGVIEEVAEHPKRRLSAPEVVITTVKYQDKCKVDGSVLTQQQKVEDKMETLSTSTHQRLSSSSFKSYSRTSPLLLRRSGSQESSTSNIRKRPTTQDSVPVEEVPNPTSDTRYLLLSKNSLQS